MKPVEAVPSSYKTPEMNLMPKVSIINYAQRLKQRVSLGRWSRNGGGGISWPTCNIAATFAFPGRTLLCVFEEIYLCGANIRWARDLWSNLSSTFFSPHVILVRSFVVVGIVTHWPGAILTEVIYLIYLNTWYKVKRRVIGEYLFYRRSHVRCHLGASSQILVPHKLF